MAHATTTLFGKTGLRPAHPARRMWFVGLALVIVFALVLGFVWTWNVDFVPDIVANHRFRKMIEFELDEAKIVHYTSYDPYVSIRADALKEFSGKGYVAEDNMHGGIIFLRANRIKAVLLPRMPYDTDGSLNIDPGATSMWTATSTDFWVRLNQRFNLGL